MKTKMPSSNLCMFFCWWFSSWDLQGSRLVDCVGLNVKFLSPSETIILSPGFHIFKGLFHRNYPISMGLCWISLPDFYSFYSAYHYHVFTNLRRLSSSIEGSRHALPMIPFQMSSYLTVNIIDMLTSRIINCCLSSSSLSTYSTIHIKKITKK